MFFNRYGTISFFICIAIYLYGDLAIYGAAVGKSLRDTVEYDFFKSLLKIFFYFVKLFISLKACTYYPPDVPCNQTLNGTIRCWADYELSRDNAYRLFLVRYILIVHIYFMF